MTDRLKLALIALIFASGVIFWGITSFNAPEGENTLQEAQLKSFGAVACKDDTTKKVSERIATCPVPANERAAFKGKEIAKLSPIAKTKRSDHFGGYIEITAINAIPNGVEVLARAWDNNNQQIGFGKDGTVDIERFVIINPPVEVPDPNGDIVQEWTDRESGQLKTRKLREDLPEAILQSLSHTIAGKTQKFGPEKIVAGRIGNTTTTVYPAASGAPINGYAWKENDATWAGTHDATAAQGVTQASGSATNECTSRDRGADYAISRCVFLFDTSSIPATDTIDSAVLYLFASSAPINADSDSFGVVQMTASMVGTTTVDVADYDQIGSAITNPTEGATRLALSAVVNGQYATSTLDATGRGWIARSGETKPTSFPAVGTTALGGRLVTDITNTTPAGNNHFVHYTASQAGTTNDPKLTVEHSAAAAAVPNRVTPIQWR